MRKLPNTKACSCCSACLLWRTIVLFLMNFIQFTNHNHYFLEENHFNWKIQDCIHTTLVSGKHKFLFFDLRFKNQSSSFNMPYTFKDYLLFIPVNSYLASFGHPGTLPIQSDSEARMYYSSTTSHAVSFRAADHVHAPSPYTWVKQNTGHNAEP